MIRRKFSLGCSRPILVSMARVLGAYRINAAEYYGIPFALVDSKITKYCTLLLPCLKQLQYYSR